MTIAFLLVLALLAAGCGGGDDTASDTDTVVTETTDGITAEETTTDETTTDDDDSFATSECAALVAAATTIGQTFSGGATGDIDEAREQFEEFAENGPDEIRADLQVLVAAYEEFAEVLGDVDIEPGETPDAEAIAALQAAIASIDQAEVTEASANVSAWTTANC